MEVPMREEELTTSETARLIGSDMVQGARVYGTDREQIGTIERVMIEKTSGRASYAVLAFGGFLGFGEKRHPIPWEQLHYDPDLDGYRVNLTRDQLEGAPSFDAGEEPDWSDRRFTDDLRGHYGGRAEPPMI